MPTPTLMELLKVGAHFGHKKEKSYPRSKQFTYTIRDNIYVINLEKTLEQIKIATNFLKTAFETGKIILFIGTKPQAKEAVKTIAQSLKMPYIVERWLGGTLTNFESIRKSFKTLSNLEEQIKSPDFSLFTKKERMRIEDKKDKLNLIFEGIRELKNLPDILFIVDTAKENVAVSEARKLGIPMVGICDTNANPDLIDVPIPANDDSQKTVALILKKIEEGIKEEKKVMPDKKSKSKAKSDEESDRPKEEK